MEQMKKLLAAPLDGAKFSIAAAAALAAAALSGFAQWPREADFRPLYTGLAAEDAGAVVQKLKESGTEFRLSENGSTVLAPYPWMVAEESRLKGDFGGSGVAGRAPAPKVTRSCTD